MPCPANGATCEHNSSIESIVLAANHWRLSTRTTDIKLCPEEGGISDSACLGGGAGGGGGRRLSATSDTLYCREGHTGPRCELCVDGADYFNGLEQRCEQCPAAGRVAGVAIALAVALIVVCGAAWWLWRRATEKHAALTGRVHAIVGKVGFNAKFKVAAHPSPHTSPARTTRTPTSTAPSPPSRRWRSASTKCSPRSPPSTA